MTTLTTAIEKQSLNQNSINQFVHDSFEMLLQIMNNVEMDLESILVKEFEQGLASELDTSH